MGKRKYPAHSVTESEKDADKEGEKRGAKIAKKRNAHRQIRKAQTAKKNDFKF